MTDRTTLHVLLVVLVVMTVGSAQVPAGTAGGDRSTVGAVQPTFEAELLTYDGEVAIEDEVAVVRGVAPAETDVVAVLVDKRADTVATVGRATANGTFSVPVPLRDGDGLLGSGPVAGLVLSPGPDGRFGLAGQGPDSPSEFAQFARDLQRRGLDTQSAIDRLASESVDATGSDDQAVSVAFELAGSSLTIREASPSAVGGRLVVRGVTNRRPATNAVRVAVTDGPTPEVFGPRTAETWGTDGVWTVEIPVPPAADPGTYTVEATVGPSSDTITVAVRPGGPATTTTAPTPTTSPSPGTTQQPTPVGSTPEPTTVPPETTTTTAEPPPGNPGGGVDFVALLTAVAIAFAGLGVVAVGVAVVVVAVRRRRRHPPRL